MTDIMSKKTNSGTEGSKRERGGHSVLVIYGMPVGKDLEERKRISERWDCDRH